MLWSAHDIRAVTPTTQTTATTAPATPITSKHNGFLQERTNSDALCLMCRMLCAVRQEEPLDIFTVELADTCSDVDHLFQIGLGKSNMRHFISKSNVQASCDAQQNLCTSGGITNSYRQCRLRFVTVM